jgi:hypothetical protein
MPDVLFAIVSRRDFDAARLMLRLRAAQKCW